MPIKLVVFDMAGTTVKDENKVTEMFKLALAKYGYQATTDAINALMGYEKKAAITKILQRLEPGRAVNLQLVANIHREYVELMLEYYKKAPVVEPLPHAEETMALAKRAGIKIGLNTALPKNVAETIVERLQWCERGLIDYLVGSDEVEAGRPNPAMIHRMMKLAGINNSQYVAKVGDTEADIREGQNAGCKYVIGVTTGAFTRAGLQAYQPTHILDDIAGVTKIILN